MIENCGTVAEETAHIGRTKNGRFTKGNEFAKGNPYTKRVAKFRRTIMASVKDDDISAIISTLVFKAKTGDTAAAKIILNYTVGTPQTFESPDSQISRDVLESTMKAMMQEINMKLKILNHCGIQNPELLRTTQEAISSIVEAAMIR